MTGLEWVQAALVTRLEWVQAVLVTGLEWVQAALVTGLEWVQAVLVTRLEWVQAVLVTRLEWMLSTTTACLLCVATNASKGMSIAASLLAFTVEHAFRSFCSLWVSLVAPRVAFRNDYDCKDK